jgi:protein-tyrosine phosphatase
MIDVHSHVLPGIDDGTKVLEEAVEFCRLAAERGTEILVATPHHKPGSYQNPRDRVLEKVEDLQKRIDAAGVRLRLAPGCEIFVDTDLADRIGTGELLTYGDNRRYILLEFSFQQYPVRPEDLIFRLKLAGVTPVIAHPERIRWFQEDADRLETLVRAGALAQVTGSSLEGTFGSRVKSITRSMMERGCIHLIASDAHDLSYRPPGLMRAIEAASEIVGAEAARRMVQEIPAAVVEGREVRVDPPVAPEDLPKKRGGFLGLFGRAGRKRRVE